MNKDDFNEDGHAYECPSTEEELLVKELNTLIADFKERGEEEPIWNKAAQELIWILGDRYEEVYECGCPIDEFGCQGYHGV